MRDTLYTNCLVQRALPVNTWTTGVATGDAIDTGVFANNFRTVLFVVICGVITNGTHAFTLQESDDAQSWTSVPSDQVQGSLPSVVAADDHRHAGLEFGLVPKKRYARVVLTSTSAASGGLIGCAAVLGEGSVSAPKRVGLAS